MIYIWEYILRTFSGPAGPSCAAGFFSCDASSCIPLAQRCNGHEDCYDGTDEADCATQHRVYQVLDLSLDPRGIGPFNLMIFWSVPNTAAVKLEFLPAIAEVCVYSVYFCGDSCLFNFSDFWEPHESTIISNGKRQKICRKSAFFVLQELSKRCKAWSV